MRYRTLVRNLVLGWLAAEWVGVLLAYSFALVVLTFFIGLVLLDLWAGGVWLLPMVLAACATGLLFAWWALAIPRELLEIVRPKVPIRYPISSRSATTPEPNPRPASGWQITGFLGRMATVDRPDRTTTSGARSISISATLDRLVPWEALTDRSVGEVPTPLPPLERIAVTPQGPIRIVDLAEPRRPGLADELFRAAVVRRTPENPGRIRQA